MFTAGQNQRETALEGNQKHPGGTSFNIASNPRSVFSRLETLSNPLSCPDGETLSEQVIGSVSNERQTIDQSTERRLEVGTEGL